MVQIRKYVYILIFLFSGLILSAQSITPETKLSICEGYLSPKQALSFIEKQENIKFSYNPKSFNIKNEIYLCKRNKSLQEIVSYILGKNTNLIIEGKYVIIKPAKAPEETKNKTFRINGIIENGINGVPLDSATIETSGYIFYSNETGFFSFKVNQAQDSITLFINKDNYIGHKLTVPAQNNNIKVRLYQTEGMDYTYMPSSAKGKNSTIENFWLTNIVVDEDQKNLSQSRRVLIDREMQFSVVPGLGTFNQESGLYRYKRSYNILAGYVGEVYGHELGLGVNIIRYDMNGVQASGIANIVGGEVSGFQLSSGANVCIGNCKGVQLSGVANTTWGNFKGVQVSSSVNLIKSKHRGLQLAPVNIVIDSLLGYQVGAVNIVSSPASKPQLSALMNYCSENKKLQYSTGLNINKTNNAPQLGLINVSKTQNSLQLGIINFADTVSRTTIGVLSFVNKGFTHLDYSLNSDLFSNVRFKTGTSDFYNIINVGLRPDKEADFVLGYGFGSYLRLWKMFGLNYDLTVSQVFENGVFNQNINFLSQLNINLNFSIAKRFTAYVGGNINMINTNNLANDASTFISTIPQGNILFEEQYQKQRAYIWPGFQIGVRI